MHAPTAKRGNNGSKFPGNPAVWRSKFLDQARAEKGATAALDTMDAPVRPTEMPMVMDVSRGPIALASPATDVLTDPIGGSSSFYDTKVNLVKV